MATTQQVAPATSPPAQAPPSGTRRNVSAAEWAAAALKISQARAQSRERLKEAAATSASAFDKLYALRKSGGSPEQLAAANAEYLRASAAVAKENKTMTRLTSRQMTAEYRARAAAGEQAPAIRGSVTPSAGDDTQTIQSLNMTDVMAPWRKEGEGEAGWRQTPTQTASEAPAAGRPGIAGAPTQTPSSQTGVRTTPPPLPAPRQRASRPGATASDASLRRSTPLARVRAASKLSAAAQRRILPTMLTSLSNQASVVAARRSQEKATRVSALAKISSTARPTLFIFFILIVGLAGFFDILDWMDKFIVAIPVIGQIIHVAIVALKALTVIAARIQMELRVKKISEGTERIHSHSAELLKVLKARHRRTVAFASESGLGGLLKGANPDVGTASIGQFVRFQSRIIWNIILLGLLESIPLIDMLPALTRSIVSVYRKQQIEHRKAQQYVAVCNLIIDKLDRQFEIELRYLSICIRLAQKLLARASSLLQKVREFVGIPQRPATATQPQPRARGPSPGSVYDIGRPAPALGFAS